MLAAGRMRSKKKKRSKKQKHEILTHPNTHPEIHINPATATTSRRHATKYVQRVRPYAPTCIDPAFVEIGFVQLSQSVKKPYVTHRQTHRQTKCIMVPCTHPGMNRLLA